jgi:hypothetical protein
MNTAIRTSLLCDTIPFPDFTRARTKGQFPAIDAPAKPLLAHPALAMARASGSPGTQLGTYTLFGSQIATSLHQGKPVISFYLNCSHSHRIHYPASHVIETRTVGRCGDHDLVELTISYQKLDQ